MNTQWFRNFDSYTKSIDGTRNRTAFGAIVTIASGIIMLLLFVSEFRDYLSISTQETAFVDPSYDSRAMLSVDIDIRFEKLKCDSVRLDAQDKAGTTRSNIHDGVTLTPIGKEGCRLSGKLKFKKVAGDFHVAVGDKRDEKDALVYKIDLTKLSEFDVTHKIERLEFETPEDYPMKGENPLNNYNSHGEGTMAQYKYHITIVPTEFIRLDGTVLRSHQYSAHMERISTDPTSRHFVQPGVFFRYDFSPIVIRHTEIQTSFLHFLTSACAILGGVFTVFSMIDSMIYRSAMALKKKD